MTTELAPNNLGSPVPRTVRGFGVACKLSDDLRFPLTEYREVGIVYPSRPRVDARRSGDRGAPAMRVAGRPLGGPLRGRRAAAEVLRRGLQLLRDRTPALGDLHPRDHEPLDL